MGSDAYWGYAAGAVVSSASGDGIMMSISPGDTVKVGSVRGASSLSTEPTLVVAGLGVFLPLSAGADAGGFEVTACEFGKHEIDDYTNPGARGVAAIVLVDPALAPAAAVVYEIDQIVVEDGNFELRMGATDYWGYRAEDRISSNQGDGIVITARVGDTILISRIRQSGSRSTKPHNFTIAGLGIDLPTGDTDYEPYEIKLTQAGTFAIDDSGDPGTHGTFTLIVEAGGGAPPPVVYEVDQIVVEDGNFELRMGASDYWGYRAEDRVSSNEGDGIVITARVGDTILISRIRQSGSRSTKPHNFTIAGLGIDLPTGDTDYEPYEIKLTQAGTFAIDDSTDPGTHGTFTLIVEAGGGGAPAGTVMEIDQFVIEDGNIELRMGATDLWGYRAEQRISSNEGDGIVITGTVGDTILVGRVRQSGSRSTKPHNFTIAGLGVDLPTADADYEPLAIPLYRAGTFAIDDSTDPGEHGTATIIVEPNSAGTVMEIDQFVIEDGNIELRMGATDIWGYRAEQQISSNEGSGIALTGKVGDTILVGRIRQSGSRSTKPHNFTIEGLGIDLPVGDADYEPYLITLWRAGTFEIDDSTDPGEHGTATLVVEPNQAQTVYDIDQMVVEDGNFQLRMGASGAWGYRAEDRVSSNEGSGFVITGKVGETIAIGRIRQSGSRSTKPHNFTINGFGVDLPTNDADYEPFAIILHTAGTYAIDDSTDPGEHGTATLTVE